MTKKKLKFGEICRVEEENFCWYTIWDGHNLVEISEEDKEDIIKFLQEN